MTAPPSIERLVETFAEHHDQYTSGAYNETEVRREFLDPFFKALGWDIDNEAGYASAYKDVMHEDAVKVGGSTKAPDYSFRIGGTRKFFLEAKKPSVSVAESIPAAYQLRRYAWSAKLPLSVLSDFEEFAIYDTRVKPSPNDSTATARIFYCTYDEYLDNWEYIASIFSREAILKGSFDKYAADTRNKRGTAEVDDAFLCDIERWRDLLARNLANRNPSLDVHDINFAVQKTIDRIVFLRICEARGTEDYGVLRKSADGPSIYKNLLDIFHQADRRYNSGIFHLSDESKQSSTPDTLTPTLTLDNKPLKDIIRSLYYPESPYEFSVLPADILGQVYERFLGTTIRLTKGHHARLETKPEVRKAGGVYYTPTYIVRYIVERTIGPVLGGPETSKQNPISVAQAARVRVLDPACGSGSFLIVAYQYLLDWHLARYTEHPQHHSRGANPKIYQSQNGYYRLTAEEKKRILLNNIFGVDIDPQATEVTKLSLLLKVLEGETEQIVQRDWINQRQRILPDLGLNIRCGNSLIGSDFYDMQGVLALDDDEQMRINAFDWEAHFPEITSEGGFDCVIGNPPYVLLQDEFRDDHQIDYFRTHYSVASYKIDTYHLFIERGISLTKLEGRASMITPANFLTNNSLEGLRRFLLSKTQVESVLVPKYSVFPGVSVDTAIHVVQRTRKGSTRNINFYRITEPKQISNSAPSSLDPKRVYQRDGAIFTGDGPAAVTSVLDRIENNSTRLDQVATVNFGKQLRNRKHYHNDVIQVSRLSDVPSEHRACYTGKDVGRYTVTWSGLACLDSDEARSGGCWDPAVHRATYKLLCKQIGKHPSFGLDPDGYDCLNTIFMVRVLAEELDPRFLLGCLNSSVVRWYWEQTYYDHRGTFPKIKGTYLKQLPVPAVSFSDREQVERHQQMVELVSEMLRLQERLQHDTNPQTLNQKRAQLNRVDSRIDALARSLYGISDEEAELMK